MSELATTSGSKDEVIDNDLLLKSTHLIFFRMGFALVSLVISFLLGWLANAVHLTICNRCPRKSAGDRLRPFGALSKSTIISVVLPAVAPLSYASYAM
jgi:hypothetical protein